jgi:uncharacterized membrane protein YdjX (TVP38/TMEM64 family)
LLAFYPRRVRFVRIAGVVAAALSVVVVAAILLPHSPTGLRHLLLAVGPAAPLVALLAWIVLTPALFPGTVIAATCGLAFGALGAPLALAGALLGGLAAFGLARVTAPATARRLIARNARLARLDELLGRRGFATILAARLMPGVPAGGLHYAAGLSSIRPRAFAGAMAIGAIVRTVPYAVIGTGLASGSAFTLIVGGSSVILGTATAAVLVRRSRSAVAPAS